MKINLEDSAINVLLVESGYRSRSWFKALQGLTPLYVLSVMKGERDIFMNSGICENNILNLHNPNLSKIDYIDSHIYLNLAEKKYDFLANQLVLSDRTLRLKEASYVTKYLAYVIFNIENFLCRNNIKLVFIEPTWAHELLTCIICEKLQIPVLAPVKSKLMPNKFFFFYGYKNEVSFARMASHDRSVTGDDVFHLIAGQKKPQYFDKFNKRNRFTWSKFGVLRYIILLSLSGDGNVNIQPTLFKAVTKKICAIIRAPFLMRFAGFCVQEDIRESYILITLHVQPEASIDVVGEMYADQLNFVRCIVRSTPSTHLVLVKEHPHAFGDRKLSFYRELSSMPRVLILSPWEESRVAVQRADLVISNTGTSSLEAAMMGIPGVTATKMYFSDLMVVPSFNPAVDKVSDLLSKALIWRNEFSIHHMKEKLSDIKKNLFPGNCGDFKTDLNVMSNENISNLRNAFEEVINSCRN